MENLQITYGDIAEILIDCNRDKDILQQIIKTNYANLSNNDLEVFKRFITKTFMPTFNTKWNNSSRKKDRFLNSNEIWLQNNYTLCRSSLEYADPCCSRERTRGRPEKTFEDSSSRSKRMKVQELCESTSEELISAAAKKNQKSNKLYKFTPEKALSLILDASLSTRQYEILRNSAKEIDCDIFPPYYQVF